MRSIPFKLWLLAALSAVLQTLSFPLAGPIPLWRTAFSWIALTPLLLALDASIGSREPLTLRRGAALGYGCGIVWYLGNCYWIYQTMYLYGGLPKPVATGILLLFCLYLGLYHALFALLFTVVRRSGLGRQGALTLSPFLWVSVELARSRVTGFPWDLLGSTLVDHSLLTRLAPLTGVYGLSFLVVAVNALWLIRFRVRAHRYTHAALTAAGVLVVVLYGVALRAARPAASLPTSDTAVLLQENLGVGTEATANYETRDDLLASFSALSLHPPADRCFGIPELASTRCVHFVGDLPKEQRASLIAWPEAPSGFRTDDPAFAAAVSELARSAGAPLVIGSLGIVPDRAAARSLREYDSAALVRPDGTSAGRYDKIHLVPWGEYVPFKQFFSFADRLTAGVGNMDRGTSRSVFSSGGHKIGVFICYESVFGDEVRQFVVNGADVLVNISDDGWYGDTSAAWQHLNMVRMRAIENRRWVLRSTNTGVTAVIDPYGRVTASIPRHIRSALRAGYGYETELTFYTRHGDVFAYGCALVSLVSIGYSLIRRDDLN